MSSFWVLVAGLLLLLAVEREEADVGDLDDLEADSRNITLGVTGTTETGNEDLIVFFDVVEATIVGDEGDDREKNVAAWAVERLGDEFLLESAEGGSHVEGRGAWERDLKEGKSAVV